MRSHTVRVVSLAIGFVCAVARADDASDRPALRIEAGKELAVGVAASIAVFAKLPEGTEHALLLTPRIEGEAVRVVRGRLSRADAQTASSGELRFDVPVIARRAGTAVLHVELLSYRCDSAGCAAQHASASSTLHVGGG
jgi:hypothetical protein